jgi:uncharacterized Zn finger protein
LSIGNGQLPATSNQTNNKECFMGFFKKLFGGKAESSREYVDKDGVYFYVRCQNCGTVVRLRAAKQYDLENTGAGFTWHKTIVDNKCFRPMPAVVHLNRNYEVESAEIEGGEFVTEAEYGL